jgi:succinyl-diaminopimelate desuccinylase
MSIDPVALLQRLLRCRSVTPDDGSAIGIVAEALAGLGFTLERLDFASAGQASVPNLFARIGTARPHLCFAGHTDVVPPGTEAAWSAGPFDGMVRDGELIGRGAVDMKGGIAAFVAAVSRYLAGDHEPGGSISLLITGDEEGQSIDGTRRVVDWAIERGIAFDACLVGEPTSATRLGDMVKIGRRGSLNGTLLVHGTAGHTAYPHLADNPAHRLVAMLHALVSQPLDQGTADFQPSTLQISTIDIGNPASNVIPANACARFNVRFNDGWTGASLESALRQRLAEWGGVWELDISVSGEAFITAPGAFAGLVADSITAVTGVRPEFSTSGGTSDARFLRVLAPVAEFGLVGKTMHQIDERVPVGDLESLTRIYHDLLVRYFTAAR